MLRLQTKLSRGDPYHDIILDPAVQAELFKLGICTGQSVRVDAVFECAQNCRQPAPNTIVFDRSDGQEPALPGLLDRPEVIGYVKSQIWADDRPKMKAGPSYLHYHRMQPFVNWVDDGAERDIDVSFAGCSYKHQPLSKACKHRSEFFRELGIIHESTGLNMVIAVDSNAYQGDRYLELLARSKVVVSPWGHGEICFRDFEALLMGCRVVKPWCDRLIVPTLPVRSANFPLEVIINGAMNSYFRLGPQKEFAWVLRSKRSPAVVARILKEIVEGCLNGDHSS